MIPTLRPSFAAAIAAFCPPGPEPITNTSKSYTLPSLPLPATLRNPAHRSASQDDPDPAAALPPWGCSCDTAEATVRYLGSALPQLGGNDVAGGALRGGGVELEARAGGGEYG